MNYIICVYLRNSLSIFYLAFCDNFPYYIRSMCDLVICIDIMYAFKKRM